MGIPESCFKLTFRQKLKRTYLSQTLLFEAGQMVYQGCNPHRNWDKKLTRQKAVSSVEQDPQKPPLAFPEAHFVDSSGLLVSLDPGYSQRILLQLRCYLLLSCS